MKTGRGITEFAKGKKDNKAKKAIVSLAKEVDARIKEAKKEGNDNGKK
jgi:hypothetical protein